MTYELEAGGIEPPSRDGSEKVSTCVVRSIGFSPPVTPIDRLHHWPTRLVSHPLAVECRRWTSPLSSSSDRAGVAHWTGYLRLGSHAQRRVAMFNCVSGFTRPTDNLGTRLSRLHARSSPFAPGDGTPSILQKIRGHTRDSTNQTGRSASKTTFRPHRQRVSSRPSPYAWPVSGAI